MFNLPRPIPIYVTDSLNIGDADYYFFLGHNIAIFPLGTTFVVSPPNSKAVSKGKLPKRLQENLSRRQAAQKQKQQSTGSSNVGVRRETIVKGKTKVSATAASRRNALKTKN